MPPYSSGVVTPKNPDCFALACRPRNSSSVSPRSWRRSRSSTLASSGMISLVTKVRTQSRISRSSSVRLRSISCSSRCQNSNCGARVSSALASVARCTSSGPSKSRIARCHPHIIASGHVVGDPQPAVHLDGPVDHLEHRPRDRHLGLGHQVAGGLVALAVDDVRRVVAQRAGLVEGDPGLRDPLAHRALVGERLAEGDPLLGARDRQRQRPLAGAEGPHHVVDAAGAEAGLGGREAAALLAEQVGDRHPDVDELGDAVAVLVDLAEDGHGAPDRHARGVPAARSPSTAGGGSRPRGRSCPSR